MAAPLPGDKRAGFTGLIVGGLVVGLMTWGIVHLTNKKFEGREGHAPAAAGAPATTH